MKIITLLNEKGGAGKTTTATHIAAGLAIKGHNVVLLDTDAQGHATVRMGLPKEAGMYNLIIKYDEWNKVMRRAKPNVLGGDIQGRLWVVPSNIETRAIPITTSDVRLLEKRLQELNHLTKGSIDYVIIDTSPTPSLFHAQIYLVTDYFIFPAKCTDLSLDGLIYSKKHMADFQEMRIALGKNEAELIGVLPTMYRRNTLAHQDMLGIINKHFPNKVLPPIEMRIIWDEIGLARQTLFAYDSEHIATQEMWQIINFVEVNTREEIS